MATCLDGPSAPSPGNSPSQNPALPVGLVTLLPPATAPEPLVQKSPARDGTLDPQETLSQPSLLEEKLLPLTEKLKYLLKKAEDFQTYLLYSRDRVRKEQFAKAMPTFLHTCQPFLMYIESVSRDAVPGKKPIPESTQKRLLEISQQLVSRLEQLALMYASFGFISLEDTDPCSAACFFCGRFSLGLSCQVSVFRYSMAALYTATWTPRNLYKKMRWNVDVSEETPGTKAREPRTEYYFLCYRDTGEELSRTSPASTSTKIQKLWSIGRWIPLAPGLESGDLFSWILCPQPTGEYHRLLTIGFEEPSLTLATDLLVQILTNHGLATGPLSPMP